MYGRWLQQASLLPSPEDKITNGKTVKMNGVGRPFVGHIAEIYAIWIIHTNMGVHTNGSCMYRNLFAQHHDTQDHVTQYIFFSVV